ncbi:MAG: DUF4202 domain-containing protein [Sandaracinaceae bacterium]
MSLLDAATAALDALHRNDPKTVEVDGVTVPAELDYAKRMTAALRSMVPTPSLALELAVRAQHLERWTLPRSDYPLGRAGYHAWRTEQKRRHAARAAEVLSEVGVDTATIDRIGALILKKNLTRDPETQALEDAACLVFLEAQLAAFAQHTDPDKLTGILQKTWRKMSEAARERALSLPFDDATRRIVVDALSA